jgi:hypothetical protein
MGVSYMLLEPGACLSSVCSLPLSTSCLIVASSLWSLLHSPKFLGGPWNKFFLELLLHVGLDTPSFFNVLEKLIQKSDYW